LTTNLSQTRARAQVHLRGQGQGSLFERYFLASTNLVAQQ
jgi:hypothetical protein